MTYLLSRLNNEVKTACVAGGFVGASGFFYGCKGTSDQTRFQPTTLLSGGAGLAVLESLATSALSRLPQWKENKRFLNAATCALFEGAALWYLGVNSTKTAQFISAQIACYALISLTANCVAKRFPQTKKWADLAGIVSRAGTAAYFSKLLWPNPSLAFISACRQGFLITTELGPLRRNGNNASPEIKKDKPTDIRDKYPLIDIESNLAFNYDEKRDLDYYTFNNANYLVPKIQGADTLIQSCQLKGLFDARAHKRYSQNGENGSPCSIWRLFNTHNKSSLETAGRQSSALDNLRSKMNGQLADGAWNIDRTDILYANSSSGDLPEFVDIVLYHKKVANGQLPQQIDVKNTLKPFPELPEAAVLWQLSKGGGYTYKGKTYQGLQNCKAVQDNANRIAKAGLSQGVVQTEFIAYSLCKTTNEPCSIFRLGKEGSEQDLAAELKHFPALQSYLKYNIQDEAIDRVEIVGEYLKDGKYIIDIQLFHKQLK